MKTLAIALALGDIYANGGIGKINLPLDGSVSRFKAVTSNIACDNDSLVVCTAGYSRTDPMNPQSERAVSLADQLARYVHENETELRWSPRLVTRPLCWGTRNEIVRGITLAQEIGFAKPDNNVWLTIASNRSHLFRISLYTRQYAPKKWKVVPVRAYHKFPLYAHVLEVPKILRDLWILARHTRA